MYETVAHFYETVALFFGGTPEIGEFCMYKTVPAGVENVCYMCNYKLYHI